MNTVAENIQAEMPAPFVSTDSAVSNAADLIAAEGNPALKLRVFIQGGASSQITLRQGFEVMLKRVAPEIEDIVDTTNHAAGKQPFYPRNELDP